MLSYIYHYHIYPIIYILSYRYSGGNVDDIPHPDGDWSAFITAIQRYSQTEARTFCPVSDAMQPWVKADKLTKLYGNKARGKGKGKGTLSGSSSCAVS